MEPSERSRSSGTQPFDETDFALDEIGSFLFFVCQIAVDFFFLSPTDPGYLCERLHDLRICTHYAIYT